MGNPQMGLPTSHSRYHCLTGGAIAGENPAQTGRPCAGRSATYSLRARRASAEKEASSFEETATTGVVERSTSVPTPPWCTRRIIRIPCLHIVVPHVSGEESRCEVGMRGLRVRPLKFFWTRDPICDAVQTAAFDYQ